MAPAAAGAVRAAVLVVAVLAVVVRAVVVRAVALMVVVRAATRDRTVPRALHAEDQRKNSFLTCL
jgi:hypothetical protein